MLAEMIDLQRRLKIEEMKYVLEEEMGEKLKKPKKQKKVVLPHLLLPMAGYLVGNPKASHGVRRVYPSRPSEKSDCILVFPHTQTNEMGSLFGVSCDLSQLWSTGPP